jgi:hypothetical protein
MSASASFKDIEAMLKHCADGFQWRLATHSRVVSYKGKTYRALPKFNSIELGHIRKMIRYLKIDENCAKSKLPI